MFRPSIEKDLETATSQMRLEPNWPSIMTIVDKINQKDVSPKIAFDSIKKKMHCDNPHSCLYTLLVLESVVKNCGAPIHDEVFTKENCEMFSNFLEQTPHDNVRQKMLELVQTWAYAFRSSEKYQAIKDTMTILKTKGHTFPELKEADAMFAANTAPNWAEGKKCHLCRTEFTFTNRRHHCRACGQVFCGKCSEKTSTVPEIGIEKEVRVCDRCFALLQRPKSANKHALRSVMENDLPAEYLTSSLAQQVQTPPRKTDQELKEEEEFQLALALSQSEAEEQKKKSQHQSFVAAAAYRMQQRSPSPDGTTTAAAAPLNSAIGGANPNQDDAASNADLAKYLNRNYWEQRKVNETDSALMMASPSAPSPMPTPQPLTQQQLLQQRTTDELQIDDFAANMRTQVEIFVNRMKSNSSRGRSIANDSSVQTLFMTLTSLHSQQLSYIKEMDDKRMWYEQLQDKLAQIKDSRAALDVLRQEHIEKLHRIAEEQERQRQIQMAMKLEIMRKKKQEYLQYQRQLALQRIQEQEREMQLRQEQQKAQYRMGQTAFPFIPQAATPSAVFGTTGSPSHQQMSLYAYNPNSPGAPLGTASAPYATSGPTSLPPLPGMYGPSLMQQQLPHNPQQFGAPSMPLHAHMPQPGAMLAANVAPTAPQQQQTLPSNQANGMPPTSLQQSQAPSQLQQPPPPQLAHVMLQHQTQAPIPTSEQVPPHNVNPANPPPPTHHMSTAAPAAVDAAQMQLVAAAPAPPKAEPAAPAAPAEPATAELISFD